MTKDQADPICASLESSGYPYTRVVDSAGNHRLQLNAPSLNGAQMLALSALLAPGGVPLPGVRAQFTTDHGITIV